MNSRLRGILVGVICGAALGALIGWFYAETHKDNAGQGNAAIRSLGPGDWVRLAITLLGTARQIGEMVGKV